MDNDTIILQFCIGNSLFRPVKQKHKSLLVITLLLLYAISLGILHTGPGFQYHASYGNSIDGDYQVVNTSQVVSGILQAKTSVAVSGSVPQHLIKGGALQLLGVLPADNISLDHAYKQLQHTSVTVLLRLRTALLLFPAHYFW